MEEGGFQANGEKHISHILSADSPFMKPEFVLDAEDAHIPPPVTSPSRKAPLFELQQPFTQQAHDRFATREDAPSAAPIRSPSNCSRAASPFLKPPKVIKHEEDNSLYVKVEDLPEDVRDHVRAIATEDGTIGSSAINPPRKLPFSEPTRLSAQPTMEEIQMCFAQVDLAILMETKPTRKFASPTFRSASATATSPDAKRCAAKAARRREKWAAMPQSQENTPSMVLPKKAFYAESDQSESDNSSFTPIFKASQNPKPFALNANLANAQPPSRMQQLLIDLANSRRNSAACTAAIINTIETDNAVNAVKSKSNPAEAVTHAPSWPPFAVSSDRSCRNSEQIQQNFSFLRNDFVQKLQEIQALAASGPGNIQEADVRAGNRSKRAYQTPVWTHGGSSRGTGGRVHYQSSWSGHSQEEYELLDPLVDTSRGTARISRLAGDAETSTDTESLAA